MRISPGSASPGRRRCGGNRSISPTIAPRSRNWRRRACSIRVSRAAPRSRGWLPSARRLAPWPRDPDGAPLYPGAAKSLSPDARERLIGQGAPYALRLDMAAALRARRTISPGPSRARVPAARLATSPAQPEAWGDVILARKETPTSYHLSVVIDDALQGVTDVVRGQDLFWSTSVHRLLQELLGLSAAGLPPPPAGPAMPPGRSCPNRPAPPACANCARQERPPADIRRLVGLAVVLLVGKSETLAVTPRSRWHAIWRPGGVRGIMAAKSRARRTSRPAERRPPKKRVPKRHGEKARPAARAPATEASPGMVEAALAAFAHEVRTPLTGILAISDLLATSDLDERERRWVDTIKAGAEHLASLATLFVDAARSNGAGAWRCGRISSICARWRATPAIRWPAGRRRRACRPRSRFRKSCRRSWSAIPSGCARRWRI